MPTSLLARPAGSSDAVLETLIVEGGRPLSGRISPSANKNAVLPILCASLLTDRTVVIRRVPDITDVQKILDLFRQLGSAVDLKPDGTLTLYHGANLDPGAAVLPAGMRASVMLIPGLLYRFGRVVFEDDAKGCALGVREIDPHIEVFRAFGAVVSEEAGGIMIRAPNGFSAAGHWLDYASVTATENFLICAAVADGNSRLTNAACEPHVQELCAFLNEMGGKVTGAGTSSLTVTGVDGLGGAKFTLSDDFHEVATFLALGAITGGEISVRNDRPDHFPLIDRAFARLGVEVSHQNGYSSVHAGTGLIVRKPFTTALLPKIEAAPWPYLPADLLPIFIALGASAQGQTMFWNKVYEGALGWMPELSKFGAHVVSCDPHRVITFGGGPMAPAEVESPYIIRAAIALLMTAAAIDGRSTIRKAAPIRRAHPRFAENLVALGAEVRWA